MDKEVERYCEGFTFIPVQPKDYAEEPRVRHTFASNVAGCVIVGLLMYGIFYVYLWARP